jgi:hypothetical protein
MNAFYTKKGRGFKGEQNKSCCHRLSTKPRYIRAEKEAIHLSTLGICSNVGDSPEKW